MIEVEKFGYDCGGSLRVGYDDSVEDWMFTPFRDEDLRTFQVLGGNRILAVGALSIKLFDTDKRTCTGQKTFSERFVNQFKAVVKSDGSHIIVAMQRGQEGGALCVYGGEDLSELLCVESSRFSSVSPVFERHDGAVIVGGLRQGSTFKPHVLCFSGTEIVLETPEDKCPPVGYAAKCWPDPGGRRVAALSSGIIPIEVQAGIATYGVSFDIWNLDSLEVEQTIVADCLPLKFHNAYCGQDLLPRDNAVHARWLDYVRWLDPARWDGSLGFPDMAGMEEAAKSELRNATSARRDFLTANIVDVAWEQDGTGFWILFSTGLLRRVGIDGTVSPRYVIERFATAPALGIRPKEIFSSSHRQLPNAIACTADGKLRVHGRCPEIITRRGEVCFDPSEFSPNSRAKNILRAIFRRRNGGLIDAIVVPMFRDEYVSDADAAKTVENSDLKARMAEFLKRDLEVSFPLADLSGSSRIAAIESLTAAINEDPYELVRGYWFRPTFVYAEGAPDEMRMGEDVFFRHVAANAPEARDAIERLLHMWMDKVPLSAKHRNYYMNEETVALSHALKALITLDPTCYDTIRRYVTELDMEHDVIVKNEILPYFGQVNGWRNLEAVRLGIFCMLEKWCGGSDGAWTDPSMQKKVMETMGGREFAELLIRETERYFSPDEATFNREAWNHNSVRNYLQECEMYNFRTPEAFDREAVVAINDYLERTKAEN